MENQTEFKGWAVVEVMGHQRHIGYVETQTFGAACLFRVDTPELPEREYEIKRPEWIDGEGTCPAGTKVRRAASPACSVLVGSASIYRIIPCSEELAREQIDSRTSRPLIVVSRPPKALAAAANDRCCECAGPDDVDEDGCDCDCHDRAGAF